MDGVVCNFVKAFSTRANRLFPDEAPIVDYMDVESWKWDEWYAHSGIIEATWKSILTLDNGNFWLGVEPLYNMDYLREIYTAAILPSRLISGWRTMGCPMLSSYG